MFVAKNENGEKICARCGDKDEKLTIDHYIPKASKMNVMGEGNLVGICEKCNQEKGCTIVSPQWYGYLDEPPKKMLYKYMRYARSYILSVCIDEEIRKEVLDL